MHYSNNTTELAKRLVDAAIAGAALVMLAPLLLIIGTLVRLDSKGPALFRQLRIGAARTDRTELFEMIKFRTMVVDAEHSQSQLRDQSHRDGPAFKIEKDPRVTKVGDFLRDMCTLVIFMQGPTRKKFWGDPARGSAGDSTGARGRAGA